MILTKFQEYMDRERWAVINKFQETYKTKKAKIKAISEMEQEDLNFLNYCSDSIHACIFYTTTYNATKKKNNSRK